MHSSDKRVRRWKSNLNKELLMNYPMNDRCNCTNCSGDGCVCGCQAELSAVCAVATPPHCECGPACGCEAAEQGCVCS
jgi:hypothetical protein